MFAVVERAASLADKFFSRAAELAAASQVFVPEAARVPEVAAPQNWPQIQAAMPMSLSVDLDTSQLFAGAQLMIDALGGPYLLIAGFGLGIAILGTIAGAVGRIRL